jgi:hypothetical protein
MNAVAMRTPVPKCRDMNRNRCGIGSFGKRLAMTGNEHAGGHQCRRSSRACLLTQCAEEEDEKQRKDMRRRVVATLFRRPTDWLVGRFILPSA